MLWSLVLLSVVAAHIASAGRTETRLASNLRQAAAVESAADGGVHRALFHLLARGPERWVAPGTYRTVVGGTAVAVAVEDLAGRINPNTATPELMGALLQAVGLAEPQARTLGEAIVARRSPDVLVAGQAVGAPRQPFETLDDVGVVAGMSPDILTRLRPNLTLWWENDPDPAVATPAVLQAMRSLGDIRPRSGAAARSVQVVSISATAVGERGSRFTRRADVVLNFAVPRLRWRILAWNR